MICPWGGDRRVALRDEALETHQGNQGGIRGILFSVQQSLAESSERPSEGNVGDMSKENGQSSVPSALLIPQTFPSTRGGTHAAR